MINKLEKLLYNTSIIQQPILTSLGTHLVSEYKSSHRWLLQEILYTMFVNKNMGIFQNILFGISCRILSGIISMNIYEYTKYNLYIYLLLVILSIFIFINYICRNIKDTKVKKNES